MLLKRMDETITQGLYDLDAGPQEVDAYVAEPSMGDGVIHWEIAASGMVPRSLLHYDDTPDASVKFNSSWRDFYASGAAFRGETAVQRQFDLFRRRQAELRRSRQSGDLSALFGGIPELARSV